MSAARRKYFVVTEDMRSGRQWVLGAITVDGREVSPDRFSLGKRFSQKGGLVVSVYHPGEAMDYSESAGDPVMRPFVADILRTYAGRGAQFLPARVQGRDEPFVIANVVRVVDCFDERRSDYDRDDSRLRQKGRRPNYESVNDLMVDPVLVGDAHVFRVMGCPELVVSDECRKAMLAAGVRGAMFTKAS